MNIAEIKQFIRKMDIIDTKIECCSNCHNYIDHDSECSLIQNNIDNGLDLSYWIEQTNVCKLYQKK